ncbi:MAG: cytochrome c oxidase assembly protein [Acidimicrobiales bacterium]
MRDDPVMLAHQVIAPSDLAWSWTFEPILVTTLAVTAFVYGRGRARLGRRIVRPDGKRRALSFYGGLLVLATALLSPLDALASSLFSGHMVQHLLLMVVAAPLLVYARPTAALVAGLPTGGRDLVRRAGGRGPDSRSGALRGTARLAAYPLVVLIVGALALWAWHMPVLYEAALAHEPVHMLEHASFVGAALLLWSVVFASGARRGVPRPVAILLVFASGVQSTALGAVLLFASTPLYPAHTAGARLWDVSLLEDQEVAGALMWGPPALLYVVVMGWLLVRWFAEMDEAFPEPSLVAAGERA